MTFKEAKKILEKEGFYLIKFGGPSDIVNDPFSEYESPEIFEAGKVVNSAGYGVGMHGEVFNERKARLKKEYEENTKAPGPGEEQTKEKKGIIYPTTFPKADFYHKYFLNEGYSALRESAYQFNDALLDEQAKKIAVLTKDKENCYSRISDLEYCIKRNNRVYLRGIDGLGNEIKRLGKEVFKLNSIIHDKNAILSDVAEELRLSKIREKNLVEVSQKYMKENEELREKVAEKTNLVETVRKGSKEYCEYGISAEKMIRKMAKVIVSDKPVSLKDFKEYRRLANGYSFNPQLFDFSEEEDKKLSLIRDDSVGAVTNQKNCSPFKDTHPTEDSPEEVELDKILELFVRL